MRNLLQKADSFVIETMVGDFTGYKFYPKTLADEEKQVLFEYVYFVGLNAFIQNPSEEMEQDIYEHLFNEDCLFIVLNKLTAWFGTMGEKRVIAFLSTRDIETSQGLMLYVSGICVDPSYQGYKIGQKLMNVACKQKDYQSSALRTQNPVMKESFDKTKGGFSFPNGVKPPEEVLKVSLELSKILNTKNYDYQGMVCRGSYSSCLYGIEPSSRTDKYEAKFNEIDKNKGDSLLCVKLW